MLEQPPLTRGPLPSSSVTLSAHLVCVFTILPMSCVYSIIITNHSLTYKAYMLWKCMIKTSGFSSNTTITENCCDGHTNHVYRRKHTNST